MKSHEVLRKAVRGVGVKAVASDMKVSSSLVYKWCEPSGAPTDGGAGNPLDRVLKIYELTGDLGPIEWLCRQTQGFRADDPKTVTRHRKTPVIKSTQVILKEFSDVLEAVSESYENGNRIDRQEAGRIRGEWEELKAVTESFVSACEQGAFDRAGV